MIVFCWLGVYPASASAFAASLLAESDTDEDLEDEDFADEEDCEFFAAASAIALASEASNCLWSSARLWLYCLTLSLNSLSR